MHVDERMFRMSEHTCLNVIFIPAFCQKINFYGVCAWVEHMVLDLWRWQSIWAIAPYGSRSSFLADAVGFSSIKWRSSLFCLSTAVSCTLKCFVNHCLSSMQAAKALIILEFWDVMLQWWSVRFCHSTCNATAPVYEITSEKLTGKVSELMYLWHVHRYWC